MPREQLLINTSRGESEIGESTHRPVRETGAHTQRVRLSPQQTVRTPEQTRDSAQICVVFLCSFLSWQKGRQRVSCLFGLVLLVPVT